MNPTQDPGSMQRARQPLSEAAQASLAKTHTLFRLFIVVVLGSLFVIQLDIANVGLSAILTAASLALGIIVLIRAITRKESKLVLFGVITGLLFSGVMVMVLLMLGAFFNQFSDFQQCQREALTQRATSECRTELENKIPGM
jgi:predicted membrane protein